MNCILRMCAIGCLLVAGFSQNPAHAAPFLLSESPNGLDTLPPDFAGLPVFLDLLQTPFPVDIGNNVITGNHACGGFGCGAELKNQIDVFRIEVPVGISVINTFISTMDPLTTHEFRLTTLGDTSSFIFIGIVLALTKNGNRRSM